MKKQNSKQEIQIQQFHNEEFGNLEVLMLNGKPYFPAAECALVLGYKKPHDAISRHCAHSVKHGVVTKTTNQHGRTSKQTVEKIYIPEGDLYRLIIRSKLPEAVKFEAWVCDTVLPSVRKYGAYITEDTLAQMMNSPEFAESLIDALADEHAKNIALENKIDELAPKARFCDKVLLSGNAIATSIIAKDYGMTAVAFNRLLNELGIQYRVGNTWLLCKEYADKGFTKTKTYHLPNGEGVVHTYWLQKGRMFLFDVLAIAGIFPQTPTGRAFIV